MGQSRFAPPPDRETPAVDLPGLEDESEPDLSDATPLQVLEDIAVRGKSETARVAALRVLLDRQQQLERERAERERREQAPDECPECARRAAGFQLSVDQAADVLATLHEIGGLHHYVLDILTAAIDTEAGRSRVARFLREDVLTREAVEEHVERKVRESAYRPADDPELADLHKLADTLREPGDEPLEVAETAVRRDAPPGLEPGDLWPTPRRTSRFERFF